jgi:hypothetical protein
LERARRASVGDAHGKLCAADDVTLSLILASALLTLAANLDLLDPQLKAKVMNSPLGRTQPWILD